jgi:hypothetical protein
MTEKLGNSVYHSLLRISALLVAAILLFQSGLLSPTTALLARNAELYVANAVGVTVGVAPTELNQITAALTEKERLLADRERALAAREIEVGLETGGTTSPDATTLVLASILFILLVLIVMNYILDFRRATSVHVTSTT